MPPRPLRCARGEPECGHAPPGGAPLFPAKTFAWNRRPRKGACPPRSRRPLDGVASGRGERSGRSGVPRADGRPRPNRTGNVPAPSHVPAPALASDPASGEVIPAPPERGERVIAAGSARNALPYLADGSRGAGVGPVSVIGPGYAGSNPATQREAGCGKSSPLPCVPGAFQPRSPLPTRSLTHRTPRHMLGPARSRYAESPIHLPFPVRASTSVPGRTGE